MNLEQLIKRIDERFVSLNEVPVRDVRLTREEWAQIRTTVLNCRTALSRKYVPMTDSSFNELKQKWIDGAVTFNEMLLSVETEVIRRAGLE